MQIQWRSDRSLPTSQICHSNQWDAEWKQILTWNPHQNLKFSAWKQQSDNAHGSTSMFIVPSPVRTWCKDNARERENTSLPVNIYIYKAAYYTLLQVRHSSLCSHFSGCTPYVYQCIPPICTWIFQDLNTDWLKMPACIREMRKNHETSTFCFFWTDITANKATVLCAHHFYSEFHQCHQGSLSHHHIV